jgi:hypothetical protein
LPESFRSQYGLVGFGEMRVVGSVGDIIIVDTYLVTVTDDKTNSKKYIDPEINNMNESWRR